MLNTNELMKRIITLCVLAVLAVSCKKEDNNTNAKLITYSVECKDCTAYVNGGGLGPNTKDTTSKAVSVKGKWTTTLSNPTNKKFTLHIHSGVFQGNQNVKASISSDNNKSVKIDEIIGWTGVFPGQYPLEKLLTLEL